MGSQDLGEGVDDLVGADVAVGVDVLPVPDRLAGDWIDFQGVNGSEEIRFRCQ